MRVLVTGGAGYIGSQMVRQLVDNKIQVVVADSLENGHRAAVPPGVPLLIGNIGDEKFLDVIFSRYSFDAAMHFAGYIEAGESMKNPGKYFYNNVARTISLLESLIKYNVRRLVFSSSAGVYGNPSRNPIPDDHSLEAVNPYGESKVMVEKILMWYDSIWGLRSISLRYFNAAGAALDGKFGEDHPNESHIIPLAFKAALSSQPFLIYGDDYPTRDGTGIRDYIHVIDLCDVHLLALNALMQGHATAAYNVGSGQGYSVREIAEAARKISAVNFKIEIALRRSGDPDQLVADSTRLRRELGWMPRYSDLETMIGTAWKWHQSHPNGYADKGSGVPTRV